MCRSPFIYILLHSLAENQGWSAAAVLHYNAGHIIIQPLFKHELILGWLVGLNMGGEFAGPQLLAILLDSCVSMQKICAECRSVSECICCVGNNNTSCWLSAYLQSTYSIWSASACIPDSGTPSQSAMSAMLGMVADTPTKRNAASWVCKHNCGQLSVHLCKYIVHKSSSKNMLGSSLCTTYLCHAFQCGQSFQPANASCFQKAAPASIPQKVDLIN